MINKNIDFLKERNSRNKGEEVVFRHFVKSKRGYMLDLFFGTNSLKYFVLLLFCAFMYLFDHFVIKSSDLFFDIMVLALSSLIVFCWLCQMAIGLWWWKYSKNVVVTNEGIWIMWYSTFWWSKAFDGKKHLLSPSWSLYSWYEIEKLSEFSDRISRTNHLKCFKIKRWDGDQKVCYLKADDFESLMSFAKENYKPKKKKKEKKGNLPKQVKFFSKLEKFFSGERDEE